MTRYCLGVESTAHTFGCGIVDEDGNVLANVTDSCTTSEGGLIPAELANHHVVICKAVVRDALAKAKLKMKDIDLISYSASPGIGHALRIGAMAARSLAALHDKPIIGVNHCIAHLEIGGKQTGAKDPVLLYASGANTQIIAYDGGRYRIFGETLDMGVGNLLDSVARDMGLGFPGGPKIEKLAQAYPNKDAFVELPYVVKGMDLSFGGIFTNVRQKIESEKFTNEELAFALQETVFAMLVEVSERAMAHCQKTELLLGGGVGCNKRLQEMCRIMCEERGGSFFAPENQFLIDNGAMIAWLGVLKHNAGERLDVKDAGINPYQRTDEIEVSWR